jgi:acetyltransferase-like isoleucine patch superfamily enzyme
MSITAKVASLIVSAAKFVYINLFVKSQLTLADIDFKSTVLGADVWWDFCFKHPRGIKIGDGTVINGKCYIGGQGGVKIGRYCHFAQGLTIYSSNHNWRSIEKIPYDHKIICKEVIIGDAVWCGANVTILPGSIIGNGVVISAGTVVRGNIFDGAVIAGNPCQIVSQRPKDVFSELYEREAFF